VTSVRQRLVYGVDMDTGHNHLLQAVAQSLADLRAHEDELAKVERKVAEYQRRAKALRSYIRADHRARAMACHAAADAGVDRTKIAEEAGVARARLYEIFKQYPKDGGES